MKQLSFLAFVLALGLQFQLALAQKAPGKYFIGANAGLNLRISPDAMGGKVATAQYGEEVEVLKSATDQSMTVDGIKGGMAQVRYKDKTGYMFDGYLVRHPMPTKGEKVEAYAGRLWSSEADVLHEERRRDWGGYAQMEYAVHFKELSWTEAFLIARNLFDIPSALQFPGDKGIDTKTTKNPNADPNAWSDELAAEYGNNGSITRLYYVHRGEGGGTSIIIEPSKEDNYALKVYELDIAD